MRALAAVFWRLRRWRWRWHGSVRHWRTVWNLRSLAHLRDLTNMPCVETRHPPLLIGGACRSMLGSPAGTARSMASRLRSAASIPCKSIANPTAATARHNAAVILSQTDRRARMKLPVCSAVMVALGISASTLSLSSVPSSAASQRRNRTSNRLQRSPMPLRPLSTEHCR